MLEQSNIDIVVFIDRRHRKIYTQTTFISHYLPTCPPSLCTDNTNFIVVGSLDIVGYPQDIIVLILTISDNTNIPRKVYYNFKHTTLDIILNETRRFKIVIIAKVKFLNKNGGR